MGIHSKQPQCTYRGEDGQPCTRRAVVEVYKPARHWYSSAVGWYPRCRQHTGTYDERPLRGESRQ